MASSSGNSGSGDNEAELAMSKDSVLSSTSWVYNLRPACRCSFHLATMGTILLRELRLHLRVRDWACAEEEREYVFWLLMVVPGWDRAMAVVGAAVGAEGTRRSWR